MISNVKIFMKSIQIFCFFALFNMTINAFAQEGSLTIAITSFTSGIVSKVHVKDSQIVKKGELLLEFDDTLIKSNLSAAKANLQLSQINLREAKKEFKRSEELYDRTVLSEHELQLAKVLYYKALSEHAHAENQLIHRQWEHKEHKVYAPFDARVDKLLCYEGQYINNLYSAQSLLNLQK